jgi:hypothetical protein
MAIPGITMTTGAVGIIMIAMTGATADGATLNMADLPIVVAAMSMVGMLSRTRETMATTIAAS